MAPVMVNQLMSSDETRRGKWRVFGGGEVGEVVAQRNESNLDLSLVRHHQDTSDRQDIGMKVVLTTAALTNNVRGRQWRTLFLLLPSCVHGQNMILLGYLFKGLR